jgi:hypothetical protein
MHAELILFLLSSILITSWPLQGSNLHLSRGSPNHIGHVAFSKEDVNEPLVELDFGMNRLHRRGTRTIREGWNRLRLVNPIGGIGIELAIEEQENTMRRYNEVTAPGFATRVAQGDPDALDEATKAHQKMNSQRRTFIDSLPTKKHRGIAEKAIPTANPPPGVNPGEEGPKLEVTDLR